MGKHSRHDIREAAADAVRTVSEKAPGEPVTQRSVVIGGGASGLGVVLSWIAHDMAGGAWWGWLVASVVGVIAAVGVHVNVKRSARHGDE